MHMSVLRIAVTASAVEQLKADLFKSLPNVKSSHRAEALGRGLGFRTYAAMLSASRSDMPPIAIVTEALFSAYLKEHGFEVHPPYLYRAVARVAIQGVLNATPKLHIYGIGLGRPERNIDGSRQTTEQRYAEFVKRREECLDQFAVEAFLRSLALLDRIPATRTIRSSAGSYRLKHIAETYACEYPEGGKLGPGYVPNGMLIAAALHMGFKHRTHVDGLGHDLPNATFNMSKTVVDDLDAEIRPRTGFAQVRLRKRRRAIWSRASLAG
jgi:hypothetical protein